MTSETWQEQFDRLARVGDEAANRVRITIEYLDANERENEELRMMLPIDYRTPTAEVIKEVSAQLNA